jgi:hypothetical protein
MATLVLSTVGTLVGGPLGGALGALIGRGIDQTVLFRPKDREGPRLTDLAVQSSQYGSPFARVHGRVRIAGTVIWATDLKERRVREGGGKGRPGTTRYSYSVSFAVALSSRPVTGVGRIWAEGNLLRGADGVFTSETGFRLHHGHGDQPLDPLIASAEGVGTCPAYRGMAYAVFEDMALEDFGNRIPSLTFEVIGDDGDVRLADIVAGEGQIQAGMDDASFAVTGFSLASETRRELLQTVATGFPLVLGESTGVLQARWREHLPPGYAVIQRTSLLLRSADAGASMAMTRQRSAPRTGALALRYYEPERDYQPGLRRTGSSASGRVRQVELPAVMRAGVAQQRAEHLLRAEREGLDRIELRCCVLDLATLPGEVVSVEGVEGRWRVQRWQWSADGVDLVLVRHRPTGSAPPSALDPGRSVNAADAGIGPTRFALFDLPSPQDRPLDHPNIALAVAGRSAGWRGAQVYRLDSEDALAEPLDFLRVATTMGDVLEPLAAGTALLRDDRNDLIVRLVRDGPFALVNADADALSRGANLAMVGAEAIQFAHVTPLGDLTFRLSGLLRGRGGTEDTIASHVAGETFVLINEALGLVDPELIGPGPGFGAAVLGRDDAAPVSAHLATVGRAGLPLSPVHGGWHDDGEGGGGLRWVRRSRGGFAWRDDIDVPLSEAMEAYRVSIVADGVTVTTTVVDRPQITFDPATLAAFRAAATHSLEATIAQVGALGLSPGMTVAIPL